MKFRPTALLVPIAAALVFVVAEQYSGCKSNESPVTPTSPCGNRNATAYGSGTASFALGSTTDTRVAVGNYVPSDQFISDTNARRGAGGFVRDTVVASKPLKGMVAAFLHTLSNGTLYDTLLVFHVYNDSGGMAIGDYVFAGATPHPRGKYCSVTMLASDALHQYAIFVPKAGLLNISLYDSCDQHLRGTFTGTLWDVSDTSNQLQLDNGQFDITYVDRFFNY